MTIRDTMPHTWNHAIYQYSYPVDLTCYSNANNHRPFFQLPIVGDCQSTIQFENHFRNNAQQHIQSWFELTFWKMYSQGGRANHRTLELESRFQRQHTTPQTLWNRSQILLNNFTQNNFNSLRKLYHTTPVIANVATIPAFLKPSEYPMVDSRIAKWVNLVLQNVPAHNNGHTVPLTPFIFNNTSLQNNDFQNYLNWIAWCRETALRLNNHGPTTIGHAWRPRDVEMCVFWAYGTGYFLNPV